MNVLVLAAGSPAFDMSDGNYPLCLTEFDGTPLIELLTNSLRDLGSQRFIFALRESEVVQFHLDSVVRQLSTNSITVRVAQTTKGAACTALLAAEYIDTDEELIIVSANELLQVDFEAILTYFRNSNADAGTVIFHSIHPRYSFVRTDTEGIVVEAAEKNPISTNATAGVYWFRQGKDFVDASKSMIRKGAHHDGFFYVCPAFNQLILKQKRITTYQIDSQAYRPLKTERHFRQYDAAIDLKVTQ